jgi:hypothetical protein
MKVFLKTKKDLFSKFKAFKAFAETKIRKKIKALHSDNNGKFVSREFQ